ncbi:MAG: hypothetical protein JNK77_03570, partial [Saprospiraceae bacterium]|nr:hypothetical protein [Saprospiraceae bacterium]
MALEGHVSGDCTTVRLYDCAILGRSLSGVETTTVRLYDCTTVRLYDC